MPPLGVKPKEAARVIGASRSQLYRLLREGKLRAVKRGVTLLVLTDSIYEHMASLPPATFGAPSPTETDLTYQAGPGVRASADQEHATSVVRSP